MPPKSRQSGTAPVRATSSSPLVTLYNNYVADTPKRLKLVDAFLLFLILSGMIQFAYCVAVTNFPFNSFIAG